MALLSKGCKPGNFQLHNCLKLSFNNIWGLHSNFVDCKSFLDLNSLEILTPCEPNLDDSIDSANLCEVLSSFNQKDSANHMDGLAVYVKVGLPFTWDLSLENAENTYLYFRLALLHSVSYFFLLC